MVILITEEQYKNIIIESYNDVQYGYKIMRYEDGYALSMADSRFRFKPKVGKMYGEGTQAGVYIAPNRDYVLHYYGGNNDIDILLKFKFDKRDIVFGDLSDREPEIAVSKALLVGYEIINNK